MHAKLRLSFPLTRDMHIACTNHFTWLIRERHRGSTCRERERESSCRVSQLAWDGILRCVLRACIATACAVVLLLLPLIVDIISGPEENNSQTTKKPPAVTPVTEQNCRCAGQQLYSCQDLNFSWQKLLRMVTKSSYNNGLIAKLMLMWGEKRGERW